MGVCVLLLALMAGIAMWLIQPGGSGEGPGGQVGAGGSLDASRDPVSALKLFIRSLERGEKVQASDLVISTSRDEFDGMLDAATRDELRAIARDLRAEDYQVEKLDGDWATLFSDYSQSFLVLRFEDGLWRLDFEWTDRLNGDA